ncbi:DUF6538 domain-containing protein [Zhengella sp. ZM62]|uniref:DUF6538 domain-containing protein n=1 Tax=Zhengella sedimenti TaxID=3390035 RepID=UPI0039755765
MEAMPNHPRLFRRGATFYHRAAIPADIKETYPKTEEVSSLRTKDFREAVRRVRIEAARVDRLFDMHRRSLLEPAKPSIAELSESQLEHIRQVYYAHLLDEDEDLRLDGFEDRPFDAYEQDVEDLDAINRYEYARGERGIFFPDEAAEVLSWSNVNLTLSPESPSWPKVIRALQAATIQAAKAKRRRNAGEVIETPLIPSAMEVSSCDTPLLSVALAEWISEKRRTSWVSKTADDHRIWTDRFLIVCGDRPIETYRKADAREFKDALMALPANWTNNPELRDLRFDEAAKKSKELGLPPMSVSNINKIIGFVAAFWNWAKVNYDDISSNPFDGMKLARNSRARDERHPFTIAELEAIFRTPLYTGCRSAQAWRTPGNVIPRDSGLYWVPLIALFTGARAGEIIQLRMEDIASQDGILRFELTDEGEDQRLKTAGSHRMIPVHKALEDLGFGDFVERCRKRKQERLFPEMRKGSDGYYSSPYSRQFRRLLETAGIKHSKNSFHSFRHCFEDACRDSGISSDIMNALQGHAEHGMAARYGSGFSLKRLAEEMEKLEYGNLDLSHLRST